MKNEKTFDETTFDEITAIITREVMMEYDTVRQLGPCNMCDVNCVANYAGLMDFDALAEVYIEHAPLIWQSFCKLMKHYGIEQPHRRDK